MNINFTVEGQKLTRETVCSLASNSQNYLNFIFAFSSDWDGLNTAALFKCADLETPVIAPIKNGTCVVPSCVIKRGGVLMSVIGGNFAVTAVKPEEESIIITTTVLRIDFETTLSTDEIIPSFDTENALAEFIRSLDINATFDDYPTENSNNAVKSKGIKEVLDTKASKSDLENLDDNISPEAHSRIFRGKNLGTSVTAEQKAAIKDGTFKDLFLGDYWVINGVTWRIVDMDYWYNTGSAALTTHHLVIMPDKALYTCPMYDNDEVTITRGYIGTTMYTTGLTQAKTTIAAAFPGMVLEHGEYLSNAVSNGKVTGVAIKNSKVELPSKMMICGSDIPSALGTGAYTYCKTQLALFNAAPKFITIREAYWLRDVVDSCSFAVVFARGQAHYDHIAFSYGVRPVFSICGG